jgi:hypothetical protein
MISEFLAEVRNAVRAVNKIIMINNGQNPFFTKYRITIGMSSNALDSANTMVRPIRCTVEFSYLNTDPVGSSRAS